MSHPVVANDVAPYARLDVGNTLEQGSVRMHRYMNSIDIVDLTHAGRRGKKCAEIVVVNNDSQGVLDLVAQEVAQASSLADVEVRLARLLESRTEKLAVYHRTHRGVDVVPVGLTPIVVRTKTLNVNVTLKDFSVQDAADSNNLTTCIPSASGGRKDLTVFYHWCKDNGSRLEGMSFRDVVAAMKELGVKYHTYCAMD